MVYVNSISFFFIVLMNSYNFFQLNETNDYDEKKQIRLALRQLRQRDKGRIYIFWGSQVLYFRVGEFLCHCKDYLHHRWRKRERE